MSRMTEAQLVVRAARVAEPNVWMWEIVNDGTQQVVETSWSCGSAGYDTAEAAERAGQARLAERGKCGPEKTAGSAAAPGRRSAATLTGRTRLIIVPRSRVDLYRDLKRSFADDPNAEVILDRRFKERRMAPRATESEHRHGERRVRSDVDAQLSAGRSVVIPIPVQIESSDADSRAVLFLCCAEHVVKCAKCQTTYRLRWLPRTPLGFSCPRCGLDMTSAVSRHTEVCAYWLSLGRVLRPAGDRATTAEAGTG